MTVTVPCDCDAEEHEVDADPEADGRRIGLYAPIIGDALPCGRRITERDLEEIVERIRDRLADEG